MTSRHFTLVELLTVTVVMTIIVGATVPAYNRIMTGNAVSYGNRLITSELNMARTCACQKRRAVAVLVCDPDLADYYNNQDEAVSLRAYRCGYVKKDGGNWNFVEWVEGSQWKFLPRGAFFRPETATQTEVKDPDHGFCGSVKVGIKKSDIRKADEAQSKDDEDVLFTLKEKTGESDDEIAYEFSLAIIFRPNGRPVVSNGGSPRVQVCEGVVTGNADEEGMIAKLNADNSLIAKVNRYTGAVVTKVVTKSPEDL